MKNSSVIDRGFIDNGLAVNKHFFRLFNVEQAPFRLDYEHLGRVVGVNFKGEFNVSQIVLNSESGRLGSRAGGGVIDPDRALLFNLSRRNATRKHKRERKH